jgi:hypothetical protein
MRSIARKSEGAFCIGAPIRYESRPEKEAGMVAGVCETAQMIAAALTDF